MNRPIKSTIKWLSAVWKVVQSGWDLYEWPVVISAGILSLLLGTIGFWQYSKALKLEFTVYDCIYQSLQLLSFQGAFDRGTQLPLSLEVARFAAPAVAAYTFIQALKEIFQRQVLLMQLRSARGHYVICGLGRKGMLLTKDLIQKGKKVVVIEQNGANTHIKMCSDMGALLVIGDARDPAMLFKAGVTRAKHLIAVCGEDSANAEIAEQARAFARQGKIHRLTCTFHIIDTYLWTLFREQAFTVENSASLLLDSFNVYDSGARNVLREALDGEALSGAPPHLLIVGLGDLGQHLVIHAARGWCLQQNDPAEKLHLSIIDPDVFHKLDALKMRCPLIEQACRLTIYPMRANGSQFMDAIRANGSGGSIPVTHAIICLDDISTGLQAGFALLRLFHSQKVNILVRMSEDSGLASFLREVNISETAAANFKAFGLLERTCKVDLLEDSTHESLARVIHEAYLENEARAGHTAAENPNLVPWEHLPEEARESNRYQANHIGFKLNAIGCGFTPWQDYGAEKFAFRPEEVEYMARMEHERWMHERMRAGWRQGPRSSEARLHPDLLPWDEGLSEESQERTRQSVRLIPRLLARAGFQIYRLGARPERPVIDGRPRP